jgi:hypothetical protein
MARVADRCHVRKHDSWSHQHSWRANVGAMLRTMAYLTLGAGAAESARWTAQIDPITIHIPQPRQALDEVPSIDEEAYKRARAMLTEAMQMPYVRFHAPKFAFLNRTLF